MNGDKAQINKMQLWSDLMKLGQIGNQTALASEWFHRQSSCDIAQGPVSFGGSGDQNERPSTLKLIVLDCIGFGPEARQRMKKLSHRPVICPQTLVPRVTAEMVDD